MHGSDGTLLMIIGYLPALHIGPIQFMHALKCDLPPPFRSLILNLSLQQAYNVSHGGNQSVN